LEFQESEIMSRARWGTATIGLLLLVVAFWQILDTFKTLKVTKLNDADPPLTLISPDVGGASSRPLVLIGHGFAGSRVIMYGFALTFAQAGYNVALWDFSGHGMNASPMVNDLHSPDLIEDAKAALVSAVAFGYSDMSQVAILGHSMGSGVALDFGVQYPGTAATIAVSPVYRAVTTQLPHNLLLMAGSREPSFLRTAEKLLAEAGGAGGSPHDGSARTLIEIPNVEHISILFAPQTYQVARAWLNTTFGEQAGALDYTDIRLAWYGLGLVGGLLVTMAVAPLLTETNATRKPTRHLGRKLIALLVGVSGSTLILWVLSLLGLQLQNLLGMLVGGFLLLWFGLTGAISWLVLWLRPQRTSRHSLIAGLVVFAGLWIAVGLLGQLVWLQWWLIPPRLVIWIVGVVMLLPVFLVLAEMLGDTGAFGRAAWWLLYSLLLTGGLVLVMLLFPGMSFLGLIMPLLPVVLGIHALVAGAYHTRWSFALSGALFLSWVIAAVFPLV
jgi:pimeloyl-ACP methyl ester carboxylesterase